MAKKKAIGLSSEETKSFLAELQTLSAKYGITPERCRCVLHTGYIYFGKNQVDVETEGLEEKKEKEIGET